MTDAEKAVRDAGNELYEATDNGAWDEEEAERAEKATRRLIAASKWLALEEAILALAGPHHCAPHELMVMRDAARREWEKLND